MKTWEKQEASVLFEKGFVMLGDKEEFCRHLDYATQVVYKDGETYNYDVINHNGLRNGAIPFKSFPLLTEYLIDLGK